jgi:hypothetical protein
MEWLRRYRWWLIGFGVVTVLIAFLAFRPDKLFVDDVVDESLSEAFPADTTSTTSTTTPVETTDTTVPSSSTTTSTTTETPNEPIAVSTGEFYGIDHSASGTATIYEQDGSYVLRFEDDTDIQNGPDLYVWLLSSADFEGSPADFIDLGTLKGNVGGQNYQLPPDFDPAIHQSVLIWCLRFSVPFAAAPLS